MSFPHGSFIRAISSLNTLLPRCVTLIPFTWSPGIAGRLMLSRVSLGKSFTSTIDRKSTRLNSSHGYISYAVFCLKKKKLDTDLRTLNFSFRHELHLSQPHVA